MKLAELNAEKTTITERKKVFLKGKEISDLCPISSQKVVAQIKHSSEYWIIDFNENEEQLLCKGFSKPIGKKGGQVGVGMHLIPNIPHPYILTREVRGIGLLNPLTNRHVRLLDSPLFETMSSKKMGFIPNLEKGIEIIALEQASETEMMYVRAELHKDLIKAMNKGEA